MGTIHFYKLLAKKYTAIDAVYLVGFYTIYKMNIFLASLLCKIIIREHVSEKDV